MNTQSYSNPGELEQGQQKANLKPSEFLNWIQCSHVYSQHSESSDSSTVTLRPPWTVQRAPTPYRLFRKSLSSQAKSTNEEEEEEEVEG